MQAVGELRTFKKRLITFIFHDFSPLIHLDWYLQFPSDYLKSKYEALANQSELCL